MNIKELSIKEANNRIEEIDNKLEYYNNLAKAHLNGDYTNFIKFINNLEIEAIKDYLKRI